MSWLHSAEPRDRIVHIIKEIPQGKGWAALNSFYEQVYSVVRQIPYGKVVCYGQIAGILGKPRAARMVGWAMRCCPEKLPWQRVVMADGSVTGGAYADMRRALLEAEGVIFLPDGRVDMKACRWNGIPAQ